VPELELLAVDRDVPGLPDVADAEFTTLQVRVTPRTSVQAGRWSCSPPGTAPPMTIRSSFA
jgi:hypothetical protein